MRVFSFLLILFTLISPLRAQGQEKETPEKIKSTDFAFLALPTITRPNAKTLENELQKTLPKDSEITDIEIEDNVVSLSINKQMVIIGVVNAPIPWTDLEWPCETSWLWRDAVNEMKAHKAHLVVFLMSKEGTKLERSILLTKILAGIANTYKATGLYWGHGEVVMKRESLVELAADASLDNLPLLAWIKYSIEKNPDDTINVLTTGMGHFECMDIEVISSKKSLDEIMNLVMGVSTIMLNGSIIKDGHTIGPDEATKIKTRHMKSVWDRPDEHKILRIEY